MLLLDASPNYRGKYVQHCRATYAPFEEPGPVYKAGAAPGSAIELVIQYSVHIYSLKRCAL